MLVKFEIYFDGKYWCARGLGADIFTQATSLDDLMENIKEAVELHYEELLKKGEEIRILTIQETEVTPVGKVTNS